MTQNAFLSLVRQYASLAKRYNRSFGEPVEALVQARINTIESSDLDPLVKAQTIERIRSAADREYFSVDKFYQVNPEG